MKERPANPDEHKQCVEDLLERQSQVTILIEQIRGTRECLALALLKVFTVQNEMWAFGTDVCKRMCHELVTGNDIHIVADLRAFADRRETTFSPRLTEAMLASATEFNNLLEQKKCLRSALEPIPALVERVKQERDRLVQQRECLRFWNVLRKHTLSRSTAKLNTHIDSMQPLSARAQAVLLLDDDDCLKELLKEYITRWPEPKPATDDQFQFGV